MDQKTPVVLPYEGMNAEAESVMMQDNYDGFRLDRDKMVLPRLIMQHSLILGTQMAEDGYVYSISPTYINEQTQTRVTARSSPDMKNVNLRWASKLSESLRWSGTINSSLGMKRSFNGDLGFNWMTASAAIGAKMSWMGFSILMFSGCVPVSENTHVGGEVAYVPCTGRFYITMSGKYRLNNHSVFSSLQRAPAADGTHDHIAALTYHCTISPRLRMATELQAHFPSRNSELRFGYEYSFRNGLVLGLIDTVGQVSCTLQDSSGMGVSGFINYWTGVYRFGFMMQAQSALPTE